MYMAYVCVLKSSTYIHAPSMWLLPSSTCSIESNRHHFYLDYEELTLLDVWEGTVGGSSELVSVELGSSNIADLTVAVQCHYVYVVPLWVLNAHLCVN